MDFKIPKLNKHSISTMGYRKHAAALVFIVIFALIGVIILTSSHAASPYSSIEASTGTLSGSAATETDANASNGSYVKFGTAGGSSSSGGCQYSGTVAPCIGSASTGANGWGTPSFDDEFTGTSLNTSTWFNESGYCKNGMTVSTSNENVSDGDLILTFNTASGLSCNGNPSSGYGAEISTNTYELPVGAFAEARVYFPGNGGSIYNWPAWWTAGPGWPNSGEHDIFEGDGGASVNFHDYGTYPNANDHSDCPVSGTSSDGNCQEGAWDIIGTWSNAFHTYGLYRGNGYSDVYYDGVLVKSYHTYDDGGGENLILTNGCGGSCTSGTQVKVDYVRAWNTNSSGFTGTTP